MKKFFKIVGFCFLGLIALGVIASIIGGGDDSTSTTTQSTSTEQTTQEKPKAEPKKELEINKPTVSKAEFEKIQNGMTYEQVVNIIGSKGEVLSEAGEKNSQFYTVIYQYDGEGNLGANANFTFQGGKLQAKAQFGLE